MTKQSYQSDFYSTEMYLDKGQTCTFFMITPVPFPSAHEGQSTEDCLVYEWKDQINPQNLITEITHVFVVNMYLSGPVLVRALCGSCVDPQLSLS